MTTTVEDYLSNRNSYTKKCCIEPLQVLLPVDPVDFTPDTTS